VISSALTLSPGVTEVYIQLRKEKKIIVNLGVKLGQGYTFEGM